MEPNHRRMYIFNWNNFGHGTNMSKSWGKNELGKNKNEERYWKGNMNTELTKGSEVILLV